MKKIISVVLCLATLLLALSACGGISMTDENKGDIFSVYLTEQLYSLDPGVIYTDDALTKICGLLFEGLFKLNADGKIENGLAESVKIIEDADSDDYRMEITIKPSKWSDGRALTANDFIYAWKRIMEPTYKSSAAALLYEVKNARMVKAGNASIDSLGVSAPDTYLIDIAFETKIDYEAFKKNLASPALVPLREDIVSRNPDNWSKKHSTIVTNGNFAVKGIDYEEGTMRIERNIYYLRDTEKDSLDKYVSPYRMTVNFVYDKGEQLDNSARAPEKLSAQYEKYQNGELRYLGEIPLDVRAEVKNQAKISDLNSTYTYVFNTDNPLFADARVRRALSLAIDRASVAGEILTYAKPATGLIANKVLEGNSNKTFRSVGGDLIASTADIDAAKALLKEAGVKGGSFALTYKQTEEDIALAKYVKGVWEELGFKVTLNPVLASSQEIVNKNTLEPEIFYYDDLTAAYQNRDFDIIAVDYSMLSTDAFTTLAPFALEFSGNGIDMASENYDFNAHVSGFNDAAYNEIIERAFAEKDLAKRAAILHEAEAYLVDQMPVIPVVFNADAYLVSSELAGVKSSYFSFRIMDRVDDKGYVYVPEEK